MQSQKQNTNYLVLKSKHWYYLNKQEKSIESQFLHSFYSDKCTLYSELILSSKWNLKLQKCSRIPTCLTLGPPAPPRRLARPEALPPPREPPNSWQEEIKWNPNSSLNISYLHKLLLGHIVEQVLQFRVSKVVEIQACWQPSWQAASWTSSSTSTARSWWVVQVLIHLNRIDEFVIEYLLPKIWAGSIRYASCSNFEMIPSCTTLHPCQP